ncbi:MAG: ubiquinone-dependent pyruvate dehydrogenase [Legionellaceae bacterium]|nr:ubiquinone-dependent pyruvate dehydrogenase [Legionellaceae bacterium]
MTTVAEVLVDTLANAGIQRIYGIVGDSLNGITQALTKKSGIEWIHVRHEEAAAFAAGAEAQISQKLAVCAGSCGPGNLHLINGLYDCQRSNAPVLAIAAHIPSAEIGGDYFQETHPALLFKECSCFCEAVESPEQMPRLLNIAMQTAMAERGVAVLIISGDVAQQKAVHPPLSQWRPPSPPLVVPATESLQEIADVLNSAKKITLFCGIGAAPAHASLMAVCKTLKAPVVHSLRAKPYIEFDNPYDVGMTGLIGFSSGYYAMEACDVLLVLGSSFPYRQFYPKKAQIIQIDIHGKQLGKRADVRIGAIGDIDATLKALLPFLQEREAREHLDTALAHYKKARQGLDALAGEAADTASIHPQYLAKCLDQAAREDAYFTCDVGTPTVWAARYLTMNGQRRLLGSFNHGSMANALSQAIGLQAFDRQRQVIALCGDGGFAMLMGEILTLIQHQLPVKIIVFNNSTLGFVEMEMHVAGMLEYGTALQNPDFAALGQAIGMKGIRIEQSSALPAAIKEALQHPGPALVDVVVNRHELVMPPSVEASQVKGFSLYLMKAILNGQGNAVLDLAKTNLWRSE